MRTWHYWTRNKLEILAGYLSAFNRASKKSSERLYIDLMAGQPENRDVAGLPFDGSARLALGATPEFTRLAFCEKEPNATALEHDLRPKFPGRKFRVYSGDCNVTIDRVLGDLKPYAWAPTFAFVDQQAAEVHWKTMAKLSRFRTGQRRVEMWILTSPAMIAKGVAGTNAVEFARRVDAFYGDDGWRRIHQARQRNELSADSYRGEMVNLLRWRLGADLGYEHTAHIPMRLHSGMSIYEMVFASDHPVGVRIMTHLYRKAAEREPAMAAEEAAILEQIRNEADGLLTLFDVPGRTPRMKRLDWTPDEPWDPRSTKWWASYGVLRVAP
jgi:three-Cys-motif partner protein